MRKQLWIYEAKYALPTKMSQVSMTTLRKIPTLTKIAKFPFTIHELRFLQQISETWIDKRGYPSKYKILNKLQKLIEELKTGD